MTTSTQIIKNKKVTVRFLNDDENDFLDMTSVEFKLAFNKIKGNLNFGIDTYFGSVGSFQFTTLTKSRVLIKKPKQVLKLLIYYDSI